MLDTSGLINWMSTIEWILEFILLPLIVIFLYDLFDFVKCYNNLCREIDSNFNKMQNVALNEQFNRMRRIFRDNINEPTRDEWVGFSKTISIWILSSKNDTSGRDYYRYLPNNELKNFIQRGYYKYISRFEENLTLFYLDCDVFSIKEQNVEKNIKNEIHYSASSSFSPEQQKSYLENKIIEIQSYINEYQPSIVSQYALIHPFFKMGMVHGIRLFFLESSVVSNCKETYARLKKMSFSRKVIEPNKWIIINIILIIIFFSGIWMSAQWANIDPNSDILLKTIALTVFYFGFALSFAALPFIVLYRWGNQQIRFGVRFIAVISLFFLCMLMSYGAIEYYVPSAPHYMIEATTAFISAIVGAFVALALDSIKH